MHLIMHVINRIHVSNPNTTHFIPIPVQLISSSTQPSPSHHHHNPIQYHPSQYHPHLTPTPTPTQHTSHSLQSNSPNPTHSVHTIPNPIQLTQSQLDVTHAITFRGEEIAKLVACGIKHYIENRNFSIGNGTLVAIAVGKKAADPKEVAALHTILTPHNPPVDLLTLTEPTMRGHIIGVCRISHTLAHDECRQSKWADSRWKYCNIITEAVQLPKPIPAKGKLGKWLLTNDTRMAITQQLQDIKLIPNGAAELYPCMRHGTQPTLTNNPLILQTLTQQGTHTHTQTEATEIEAAPQHGEARSRTNEQQAERKSRRTLKQHDGEATDDDLKTAKITMAKESHSSIAAAGYTAAGNNQSKWYNAKEEYRKARRSAWRTHEEGTERYRRDGHTAANTRSSEPHMAAHTTRAAHPMKGVETYMCVDEDGERRRRTKRENNIDATAPGAAQPRTSLSIEPSDAASGSHSSRETIGILAEAKSRFIQKGNFHDIGIEKKRERDPG